MAKHRRPQSAAPKSGDDHRNSRATVGGASEPSASTSSSDDLDAKRAGAEALASRMPFNTNKPLEYDAGAATAPEAGQVVPHEPIVGSSTVTEKNASEKVGGGGPPIGVNKTIGPLDRVRLDSTNQRLTTNQGVAVGDNQNSLKAGRRGPTLLEDFILREKITHFDHERIPECIVHARGSAGDARRRESR